MKTHVTEWGLGACAGLEEEEMGAAGLAYNTRACDRAPLSAAPLPATEGHENYGRFVARDLIPTCPRCAVLRDAALEGRLPERGAR